LVLHWFELCNQKHAAWALPALDVKQQAYQCYPAAFPHWRLAMPALQVSFLVRHIAAVLDAVKSQEDIATPDVLAAVAEVHKELQAIQEAAAVLPTSNSTQRRKAQQGIDVADVDLELFTALRQVQCR
jgi:hypothetical protein